jgi:CRISPR-associated protein Csb1
MNTTPFTFGGFTVPAGCQRIYITAQLESSNGDPRIQPTGFPDVGPVCYPDPNTGADSKGLICLIQSEPAMANLLEEVSVGDKYTGTLKEAFAGLPYIKVTANGQPDGEFKTASTIDGHRFASEYLMKSLATFETGRPEEELVSFVKHKLGASESGDHVPAANVPRIFALGMELDPMSLIHGFQISIKNKLTFVGLRSPRALTACILGYRCQQRPVPGVRIDPIGTGDAGQAIFQKERIVAGEIEAKFSIDVGLLASMQLASLEQAALRQPRFQLLAVIALWKVASLLADFDVERSLRTECKLRLIRNQPVAFSCEGRAVGNRISQTGEFDFATVAGANLEALITNAQLPANRSPLTLRFGA